jgi:hypothetical protein
LSWTSILSSTNPVANGTAAVGISTTAARADHVHPTTGLGLTASGLNQFASTTSAQLAGVISDETGSGALVFANSPTFTGTVSGITKAMVGLGNVDNTSLAAINSAIADLQARTPFRMEVRSTDVGGASAVMKSVGVTFTSGRFTLTPIITATVASTNTGALIATVDSLGSTGFTLRLRHSDNTTFAGTFPVSWIAIQRSSGAASG